MWSADYEALSRSEVRNVFRLFNDSDQPVTVSRRHLHGDEAPTALTVNPGDPFEASETVYAYSVSAEHQGMVLTERSESLQSRVVAYAQKQREKEALIGVGELNESLGNEAIPPIEVKDTLTLADVERIRAEMDGASGVNTNVLPPLGSPLNTLETATAVSVPLATTEGGAQVPAAQTGDAPADLDDDIPLV